MKIYSSINQIRKIDIRVFDNEKIVYESSVQNVPTEIGKWRYSKAEKMNSIELYVYDEGKNNI